MVAVVREVFCQELLTLPHCTGILTSIPFVILFPFIFVGNLQHFGSYSNLLQVENSPFVERLLKKGFEVLFLTEAIDEYAINAIPEFEGKKFQNVAKEGLTIDEGEGAKERMEELKKVYEPLTKWLGDEALKDEVSKESWRMLMVGPQVAVGNCLVYISFSKVYLNILSSSSLLSSLTKKNIGMV